MKSPPTSSGPRARARASAGPRARKAAQALPWKSELLGGKYAHTTVRDPPPPSRSNSAPTEASLARSSSTRAPVPSATTMATPPEGGGRPSATLRGICRPPWKTVQPATRASAYPPLPASQGSLVS